MSFGVNRGPNPGSPTYSFIYMVLDKFLSLSLKFNVCKIEIIVVFFVIVLLKELKKTVLNAIQYFKIYRILPMSEEKFIFIPLASYPFSVGRINLDHREMDFAFRYQNLISWNSKCHACISVFLEALANLEGHNVIYHGYFGLCSICFASSRGKLETNGFSSTPTSRTVCDQ